MGTTKEQREELASLLFQLEDKDYRTHFDNWMSAAEFCMSLAHSLLSDADERDRLAERVRELETTAKNWRGEAAQFQGWWAIERERAEAAEAKLAVAVEALEAITNNWSYDHDHGTNCRFCDQYEGHEKDCEIVKSRKAIAKIKGAP